MTVNEAALQRVDLVAGMYAEPAINEVVAMLRELARDWEAPAVMDAAAWLEGTL